MRLARTIAGFVLTLLGVTWALQGANVLTNSPVMSGHSEWTWIGLMVAAAGLALVAFTWRRRK